MGDFKGGSRSLDYSSYLLWQRLQLATFFCDSSVWAGPRCQVKMQSCLTQQPNAVDMSISAGILLQVEPILKHCSSKFCRSHTVHMTRITFGHFRREWPIL